MQFAADQCPKGSIYGFAKAFTPLFDKPIEGYNTTLLIDNSCKGKAKSKKKGR